MEMTLVKSLHGGDTGVRSRELASAWYSGCISCKCYLVKNSQSLTPICFAEVPNRKQVIFLNSFLLDCPPTTQATQIRFPAETCLSLKGQCHEIFCFRFFSWITFPQAPENDIRVISKYFENSRRYSQVKVHHRCQRHRWQICHRCQWHRWQIAAGINDTGGKFATGINDTDNNNDTSSACVVDTGGKFATGVNDTGGKFAAGVNDAGGKLLLVSTTLAANLPPVSLTPVANNGNNIRLQKP